MKYATESGFMMIKTAMIKVMIPSTTNESPKNISNPNKPRKPAKVKGINSGNIKIKAPATIGKAVTAPGNLKAMNMSPNASKYPPAIK